jgi:hypothetical protein
MRTSIILAAFFVACNAAAQTGRARLWEEFLRWTGAQIEAGLYWPESKCNRAYIEEHGYPEDRIGEQYAPVGVSNDHIVTVYADVDGDGTTDQFVAFDPYLCDGGNAMMGQVVVLTVTADGGYRTLSTDEGLFAGLEVEPERAIRFDGIRPGRIDAHYVRLSEDTYGFEDEEKVVFDYRTGKIVVE